MYTLLVVDDEKLAVKGITQGIDWSDIPFGRIFEAFNVKEAKRILEEHRVDILISDIEMPGEDGLELQQWIREHSPATETIFLTGHANFAYAQKALQLNSFDYVLKPVDHDELKETVRRAIRKIEADRQWRDFYETYRTYYHHWLNQLPTLVERFWQDLLAGRVPLSPERLQRAFDTYDMPLSADSRLVPVLISVEEWREPLDTKDEEIMEYALRKAASEIILAEQPGAVIRDGRGFNLAIVYEAGGALPSREELRKRCREYLQACSQYFHCQVSCYIGKMVTAQTLAAAVTELLGTERYNISKTNNVLDLAENGAPAAAIPEPPQFSDWSSLLESGKAEALLASIDEQLNRLGKTGVSPETLESFAFALLHAIYQAVHRRGMSVYDIFSPRELADHVTPTRSVPLFRNWAARLVGKTAERFREATREDTGVVGQVKQYIAEHLHEENLNREQLAAAVYLNPAYLSRLFRKETGLSLHDYISQQRIEKAKKLLAESSMKVSVVAETVGYSHFSHFAKMFRKLTGMSPHDYRKVFQKDTKTSE
ncbi:MAG: hypothetical protein BLM47_05265 [Candidatus Reconcilbacillus cellulovorans]|uniref:DNA-binding response regulator n=1 Tax=Candidatus Reconcilbacillus cellulovorans TaxID=1906605 RepID=A0A2A6E0T9_9BACL|nr:MAG: hypothetical protein BLM47_05265 [Candidatus Reconcilbacillus cellulovorans]